MPPPPVFSRATLFWSGAAPHLQLVLLRDAHERLDALVEGLLAHRLNDFLADLVLLELRAGARWR